jgi:hypothetical protein
MGWGRSIFLVLGNMAVILSLSKLRLEGLETSLGYIARPHLKNKQTKSIKIVHLSSYWYS